MEELLRCPFCGGEAEMHYGIFTDDAYYVECIECKANSHVFFEKNSAIAAWNRRTQNIGKKECCVQEEEQ